MRKIVLLACAMACLATSCVHQGRLPRADLARTGIDTSEYHKVISAVTSRPTDELHSLMVVKGGEVIYERYQPGFDAQSLKVLWSASKSFTSTAIGLAVGVLATAIKAHWSGVDEIEAEMYRWTTRLNAHAAEVIRAMELRAATDVTGFGLGGHILEMARGSGVSVELHADGLPFMENAEELASCGLIPAGTYRNRDHASCHCTVLQSADELKSLLAFDAQTSGGLVLAVPQERVQEAVQRLAALGEPAWIVGQVLPLRPDKKEQLIIA